jgi:hypothetical protein
MTSFLSCLKKGQHYERKALEYFPNIKSYKQSIGCFKDYDLLITQNDNKKLKVEVKADFMACKTGNLAVEWECSGKPSGISTSKADLWVFFTIDGIKEDCYIIPTNELSKLTRYCHSVSGGDGKRARMSLLPINLIIQYRKEKHTNEDIKTSCSESDE